MTTPPRTPLQQDPTRMEPTPPFPAQQHGYGCVVVGCEPEQVIVDFGAVIGEGLDKFQLRSLPLKLDHGGDRRVNTRKLITLAEFTVLNALDCNERRANAFEAGPCLEKFSAQPERIGREQIVSCRTFATGIPSWRTT